MNSDIAMMTVSDFRKFKAALAVLLRAGVNYPTAVEILVNAHGQRLNQRHDDRLRAIR